MAKHGKGHNRAMRVGFNSIYIIICDKWKEKYL